MEPIEPSKSLLYCLKLRNHNLWLKNSPSDWTKRSLTDFLARCSEIPIGLTRKNYAFSLCASYRLIQLQYPHLPDVEIMTTVVRVSHDKFRRIENSDTENHIAILKYFRSKFPSAHESAGQKYYTHLSEKNVRYRFIASIHDDGRETSAMLYRGGVPNFSIPILARNGTVVAKVFLFPTTDDLALATLLTNFVDVEELP